MSPNLSGVPERGSFAVCLLVVAVEAVTGGWYCRIEVCRGSLRTRADLGGLPRGFLGAVCFFAALAVEGVVEGVVLVRVVSDTLWRF
jgi:hypothetical protein